MSKIATALGLSLGLICWAQSSMADPDDSGAGQTPSSALPLPQVNGTGPAQGWRRHHRMQADAAAGSTTSGTTAGANAGGGTGSGPGQGQGQGLGGGRHLGQGGGQGAGHGQHGGGQFKAVMGLQSLTADQRQKIKGILDGLKQDQQALHSQMEAAGAGRGQAAGAAAGTPAKGAPAAASAGGGGEGLRKQMRQKRMAAWQQIKGLLSDAQIKELDQAGNNGQLVAPKGTQASAAKANGAADSE